MSAAGRLPSEIVDAGWTQGDYAEYEYIGGQRVEIAWCPLGAVARSSTEGRLSAQEAAEYLESLEMHIQSMGYHDVPTWNDSALASQDEIVYELCYIEEQLGLKGAVA